MSRIVAVIQARIGSSRLPSKVLMDIAGRPMLWHVVNRLNYSSLINNIVIATTTEGEDDAIEGFCAREGIDCYRGSEENVLDRYYQAAKFYKADIIVRITADCPLIDPHVSDKVISGYLKNMSNFDGASNIINRRYPRGLDTEVISLATLEKTWKEAKSPHQTEHVTPYIYEHPELFKLLSIENDVDLSGLRWTVDEEVDLKLVRELYARLYKSGKSFFLDDILQVLTKEPHLVEINKFVKQKKVNK